MLAPIYTKCSTISANNISVYSARIVCLLMFAYVWECLFVRDRRVFHGFRPVYPTSPRPVTTLLVHLASPAVCLPRHVRFSVAFPSHFIALYRISCLLPHNVNKQTVRKAHQCCTENCNCPR